VWRKRYNHELCKLFNEPDIVKYIKIDWAGHVVHMDNNDIKILGVKNWKNLAMKKESWQKLLRKARVHVGLLSQW
jgi:hypothetical protein